MEHNLNKRSGLPMMFLYNHKDKIVNFATDDLVMEGDTIVAPGVTNGGFLITGTVKEVLYEEPSKGTWSDIGDGHTPTTYKVQLY